MIAFIELPPVADLYDRELKASGAIIAEALCTIGRRQKLERNTNLYSIARGGWIFINNGTFKCYHGTKLVRLYERGDLATFVSLPGLLEELRCTSEFGSEVTIFENQDVMRCMAACPDHGAMILRHIALQSTLLHILSAAYTTDELHPEFRICEFDPGTVIIAEGAPALEIYQMIQGTATVTVQDVEVGMVGAGEVFGEISFFTGLARSATVTARTSCTVQIMDREDFLAIARMKPSVNIAVSRTLAERLIEMNRKIAEKK